jgi:large subunit ribosomal protein L35
VTHRNDKAMFTLARFRPIQVPLARANSTLESLSRSTSTPLTTASDASASHPADPLPTLSPKRRTQGRRNPKYSPIRPSISLERPREWNPPVRPGVIPAYDEAVAYIRADAADVQAEADALRLSLDKGEVPTEDVEDAKKRLDMLEIMAQVNLPEVRWKAANGMGLCFSTTLPRLR